MKSTLPSLSRLHLDDVRPLLIAFLVSLAVILLQLVQTRIFSVVFWVHLVYFIISIALLGFGISGTWLAFGPDTRLARWLTMPRAAWAFTAAALFSSFVVPATGISAPWLTGDATRLAVLLVVYAFAVLPYFFAGWILGILFRDQAAAIHRLYFADLVGAGLGCVVFLLLIAPLGAARLVTLATLCVLAPFVLDALGTTRRILALTTVAGFGGLLALGGVIDGFIQPERSKNMVADYAGLATDDRRVIEFTEWNSIARIDVVTTHKNPNVRYIYMDGGARTTIQFARPAPAPPFEPDSESMLAHRLPYLVKSDPAKVLVIGSGGGIDVWNALRAGAKRIDAVEVNGTTARLGLEEYRSFNNNMFHRPGVAVFTEDGRNFIRASRDLYDVIAIHAIDTFAAINAGAYVLSENYLYSVEAFDDYLRHLSPGGVLSVSRWYQLNEATRLFATVLEGLKRFGVAEPTAHIIGVTYPLSSGEWITLLVSRTPFSAETVARVRDHAERYGRSLVFPSDQRPREAIPRALAGYAQFFTEGRAERFLQAFPYDVRPNSDDSPFFFHYERWRDTLRLLATDIRDANWVRGNWPSVTLFGLSAFSLVAVVTFIFLPLLARGRRGSMPRFPAWSLYFTGLGVSFIFVEIALMQRFALLLGHPSRSLVVVLGTLLFSAGIGSYLSDRVGYRLPIALSCLTLLILAAAFVFPLIGEWALALPFALRVAAVIILVAPLGLLMGMPFPIGIGIIARSSPEAVPWMWGINGGTTVLGSLLAIIIAMGSGFTQVLTIAAIGYALAALAFVAAIRGPSDQAQPVAAHAGS